MTENLKEIFAQQFKVPHDLLAFSPGRINLIGEHTDYNEGFVLPAAIDKGIYVAIGKRQDKIVSMYAAEFDERYEIDLENIKPSAVLWANYILGVVAQLLKAGHKIGGFNISIQGDLPIGAGLSSSAAVECAVIFALNELFGLTLDKSTMATFAQQAEHEYAGVKCGIMDQFASMFGKKDHVIRLDCRNLEHSYEPFSTEKVKLVLLDTTVKHSLASSEYNVRRQQCEAGVELIQAHKKVNSLRDVTLSDLEQYVLPVDKLVFNRCKYVVEENARLLSACEDLRQGDLAAFGKKMFTTHEGLSILYEVSCDELDFLVRYVKNAPGVLGARMMGGGFGGCTINLVANENVEQLITDITEQYTNATGKTLRAYVVSIENGTTLLN